MDMLVAGLLVVMVGIPLVQFFLMRKAFRGAGKRPTAGGGDASPVILDGVLSGKSPHGAGKDDDSVDSGSSDGGDGGGGGGE